VVVVVMLQASASMVVMLQASTPMVVMVVVMSTSYRASCS
jgi:hypothetical protein